MPPFLGAFFLRVAALFRPGDRGCHRTLRDVPFAACRYAGELGKPMPLVFCPAISAGSVGRSSRSTESPVFAWSLASISVPRFLQVSGRGKNERHWLGKLRATQRVRALTGATGGLETRRTQRV